MRRIPFTDVKLRALKPSPQYVTYWDKALPSFGIRVGILGKTFVVVRGKARKRISIGKFPRIGLSEARRAALAILDGTSTIPAVQDSKTRISAYVDQLQATPRWQYEQKRLLNRYLLPKSTDLTTVTKQDILAITDSLAKKPSEQLHCHRAMKAFFNYCVARDYLTASPLEGLPLPSEQKTRDRVLTPDELKRIWHGSKDLGQFGIVIRLSILTGQRKGQIAQFQQEWRQHDLAIFPASAMKGAREHILPLTPITMELFKKLKVDFKNWGIPKTNIDAVSKVTSWTIHDLRRTFATLMAELQIAPHIIERILHHASGEISGVSAIYNRHKYIPEMRAALEKYEAYLVSVIGQL